MRIQDQEVAPGIITPEGVVIRELKSRGMGERAQLVDLLRKRD